MKQPYDDPTGDRIVELLRDVDWPAPDPDRMREMRTLLASSPLPKRTRQRGLSWIAAAAVLIAAIVATHPRSAPFERAVVKAEAEAEWSHQKGDGDTPERVRLHRGTIRLTVDPLAPRERFILETDDAEIEVRGTRFEVSANAGRLMRVSVEEGLVDLYRLSAPAISLAGGETWRRASAPRSFALRLRPRPPIEPSPPRAQAALQSEDPSEAAFRDGWTAFGRADLGTAAELFARAEANPALAEDAGYGRAIALSRAGRTSEAADAVRRFLERYPSAARADELSIALGWLLVDAGELDEAEHRFRAARSTIEPLQRSAERGLQEVARKRAAPR